ncbi:MAG: hypothetical protein KU28_01050 [Sulfurovum sp. PC08-66]|nr:MAG: hypothetical protein KU28_01050 [Sulfurovum sp. PC08-66]KIM12544.1 MAG: hypothetical protein KU37_01165 [Sulfuricurvum sp. PC08-66]
MLIYGKQTVLFLVEHFASTIETLYLAKEVEKKLYNSLMDHASKHGFEVVRTKPEHAQQMVKSGNHQGFIAKTKPYELQEINALKNFTKVVVLSGLTDMGNIGAIIRSAYALGVEAIVIGGVAQLQLEAMARTSSGAMFGMTLVHWPQLLDLPNTLHQFGFTLYGASMQGVDIRTLVPKPKWALFLGGESEGLQAKLEQKLDMTLKIAMEHDFDSLNVSVAAAIIIDRMR